MSATRVSSQILFPGLPGSGLAPRGSTARHRHLLSILLWMGTALAIVLAESPRAAADEPELHVDLDYDVRDPVRGCWNDAEFRLNVARRVGYDPFRGNSAIKVMIRIGGTANAVNGQVEWRKANGLLMGERRFIAKDGNCVKLLTEMSFAVGLQIDLLRPRAPSTATGAMAPLRNDTTSKRIGASSTLVPPSAAAPDTAPENEPRTNTEVATTPPTSTHERAVTEEAFAEPPSRETTEPLAKGATPASAPSWSLWVGLGPALAWRLAPTFAGDARFFLGFRSADLSMEVAAEVTSPSTMRRWDGSGFRQSLLGGTLVLCGHHTWLSACMLGRASAVRVTGLGVDEPRSPTGFVAHAGLRLAATLPLGGAWFFAAHLDGLGLLTQRRIVLNQAAIWDMPRLGALAGLDILVRFP